MKVVKWLLVIIAVLVAVFVVVGLFLPSAIHVERSVTIDAPPEVVFKYLNDLEEWEHWEPFSKSDPSVVTTIGEPSAGLGATQSWVGDSGAGSLTFTMADPDKGIAYDLRFDDFEPSTSEMIYEVVDGKTVLTWTMDGNVGVPVIGGYFALMIESMVGPEYDKGLGFLRDVAEADAGDIAADASDDAAADNAGE